MTNSQNVTGVKVIFAPVNILFSSYMIGSIIGAGVGLFSSIYGGIKASKQAKKAEAELKSQRQANEDWYRRRYNEDYTQTAEAQRLMTQARDLAREQIQGAVGRQAVMGGTTEVANARAQAADMVSDTLADLAVVGSKRKDAIESQYLQRDSQISQQYQNLYNQRAANISNAAGAGMKAGMELVGADLSSYLDRGKGLFGESLKNKKKQES